MGRMVATVLVLSATSTLVVATAYALVARRLALKRSADARADRAMRSFAAWWGLTSFNQILGSALYFAAAWGYASRELQTSYVVVQRLLLAASLAALMHYLVYLLTGHDALAWLGFVYSSYFAFSMWTVFVAQPSGVLILQWRTDLAYATAAPTWSVALNAAWLLLPPLVGGLMLLSLLRRVEGRGPRARLVAVSLGLTLWWLVAVVAGQRALLDNDVVQLVNRAVGIVVALGILVTFEPATRLARWLRIDAAPT